MLRRQSLSFFLVLWLVCFNHGDPDPRRGRGKSSKLDKIQKKDELNITANGDGANRDGKLFSLFNIVQFQNAACRSTSALTGSGTGGTNRNGTCYTANECSSRAGTASGSCAAGFGVCCIFLVETSGATITQNCTYLRNPGFPSGTTAATSLQFTVNKCQNNICRLRLDFENFNLQGTGNTNEFTGTNGNAGGTCQDTFDITVTTGQRIPQICGQNTGQHVYVDIGRQPTDSATLAFTFTGTTTNRMWEIKVSQIPCFNACSKDYLPPEGCLQYHTGITGRLTTFNFDDTADTHLRNQDYSICIRQEDGFCCIQYIPCADANSFSLDSANAGAMTDTLCTLDFVGIPGSSAGCNQGAISTPLSNRYCGTFFSFVKANMANAPVCDCTKPFIVDIFTNAKNDAGTTTAANAAPSRGLCLMYMQIPCV